MVLSDSKPASGRARKISLWPRHGHVTEDKISPPNQRHGIDDHFRVRGIYRTEISEPEIDKRAGSLLEAARQKIDTRGFLYPDCDICSCIYVEVYPKSKVDVTMHNQACSRFSGPFNTGAK